MNKPLYEAPTIVRHQSGMMNKFGRAQAMKPMESIAGVDVEELVGTYGSPLFVFSERELVSRYRELHDLASLRLPKVRIAWSYKTNYLDGDLLDPPPRGCVGRGGLGASSYDKALWRLGVPAVAGALQRAVQARARCSRSRPASAGVRSCTSTTSTSSTLGRRRRWPSSTASEPEASRCASTCRCPRACLRGPASASTWRAARPGTPSARLHRRRQACELAGLHCHIGTFISRAPPPYRAARHAKLAAFANQIRDEHGDRRSSSSTSAAASRPTTRSRRSTCQGTQSDAVLRPLRRAPSSTGCQAPRGPAASKRPPWSWRTGRAVVDDAGYLDQHRGRQQAPAGRASRGGGGRRA